MYCSIDKIDLAASVDGRPVAIQTDDRSRGEIEAEPELSALYAMARVLNARGQLADDGHPGAAVHYVVADEPPPLLRDALRAAGATIDHSRRPAWTAQPPPELQSSDDQDGKARAKLELFGAGSPAAIEELADRHFAALARRTATRIGSRDLAIALRMLEDQTFADPPRRDDERAYWARVLELAALTGELLRARFASGGRWVQTDRAQVPFGFELSTPGDGGSAVMFPTNRAQRVIEDGRDESLFKLLVAAEETVHRPLDAATGRLMPSLRHRRNVELDEVVWRPVLSDGELPDLPIVVCGIDGESTFGMIRRETLERPADQAMAEALANLADEPVEADAVRIGELSLIAVSGGFYAAEKLLDRAYMRGLHDALAADMLAAAVPTRGLLLVAAAPSDPAQLAKLAALVRYRHDEGGGRAISPAIMLIADGDVVGYITTTRDDAVATPARDDVAPEPPRRPGFLRRLLGRK